MPRLLRFAAWGSFVANVAIIGTGGAVRLTASGLGCSEWPLCTPESLVPTPELGIHGAIEFGNRLMTGVLSILAVLVIVLVWRMRRERRDLFVLALIVLGGIAAQGIVGGITVWTDLNPFIVGFHYVASVALSCVTAVFIVRMNEGNGLRERAVPQGYAVLTHITTLVMAITVIFGILTTGAGPHSGDAEAGRNGFDATLLSHIHAWPGYALLALTLVLLIWAAVARLRPRNWMVALLILQVVQVVVGVYQARNGLPPFAVGVHMVLAALVAAAMTVVVLRLKQPVAAVSPQSASSERNSERNTASAPA